MRNLTAAAPNPARSRPADHPILRAAFATFAADALAQVDRGPETIASERWPNDMVTRRLIARGDIPLATTGTESALVPATTADFFASLPASAGARLIGAGLTLPLGIGGAVTFPHRASAAAAAAFVAEGSPIPVTVPTLGAATVGPAKKAATILVASRELARRAAAELVFKTLLLEAAALAMDAAILSDATATDARPAGILAGVTPVATGYGGGDELAIRIDLTALAAALGAAGAQQIVLICCPRMAAVLALVMPLLPWPVWTSTAVADGKVIGLDPSAFVFGAENRVELDTGTAATIHMSDAPGEIVTAAGSVADPVRSLFQTDSLALRMVVPIAFTMRGAGLVQVVEGVSW